MPAQAPTSMSFPSMPMASGAAPTIAECGMRLTSGSHGPRSYVEVMVQNGDSGKPIFASEIGWNALPLDFPDEQLYGRVSPATQAAYTLRAYQRAQEEWPWMSIMALWQFRFARNSRPTGSSTTISASLPTTLCPCRSTTRFLSSRRVSRLFIAAIIKRTIGQSIGPMIGMW